MTLQMIGLYFLSVLVALGLLPAAPLAAQVRDTAAATPMSSDSASVHALVPRSGTRSPELATLLGILHPGLGHYYAGEYEKGARIEGLTISGFLVSFAVGYPPLFAGARTDSPRARELREGGAILAGAFGLATWIYGAVDAPRAARRRTTVEVAHFVGLLPTSDGWRARAAFAPQLSPEAQRVLYLNRP